MPRPKKAHPLDTLTQDPLRCIALMLWKDRLRNPDLYAQIDEKDIQGFQDCTQYLKVKPTVKIYRPQGIPAQSAIPATHNRRAVPAREEIPPKPYVLVTLVDEKGDAIKPVENNEEDYDASIAASQVRKAKEQAPILAERLVQQGRTGEFSLSDMQDAANALLMLARVS